MVRNDHRESDKQRSFDLIAQVLEVLCRELYFRVLWDEKDRRQHLVTAGPSFRLVGHKVEGMDAVRHRGQRSDTGPNASPGGER